MAFILKMKYILFFMYLFIITMVHANDQIRNLINEKCGNNFFNISGNQVQTCSNITKQDASKIKGILCIQK